MSEADFVWTQLKINMIFEKQKNNPPLKSDV